MTVAAQLDVVLGGDNSGAVAAIEGTNRSLAGAGVAITAWGAVGVAALKNWTSGAINLEQTWANTAAVTGQTIDQVTTAYTGMTADLAVAYGKSQQDIATGIYDIAQAGNYTVDQTNAIITAATQGAAAGLTTVAVATDGLTTVLNGYRNGVSGTALEVADLNRINDVMFKTVAAGKISYEELNQQWGDTVPLASQLGVSIEELGAGYASMTSQGISASEASTQLSSIMSGLLKPSTALTDALAAQGYESGLALVQQEGLAGALKFVSEATGGQSDALAELFPNIRATRGLTALLNGDFGEFLGLMTGATEVIDPVTGEIIKLGATQDALGKSTDTTGFQIDRLKAAMGVLGNQIGTALLPFVKLAAEGLSALVGVFIKLPEPIKQFIGALVGISSAGFLVVGALIAAKALLGGLGITLLTVIAPILAVAAALALLSVAWAKNWGGIRTATTNAVNSVKKQFDGLSYNVKKYKQTFDLMKGSVGPVAAGFFAVSQAADDLGRRFPALSGVTSAVSDAMKVGFSVSVEAGKQYDKLREHMNPLAAGLQAVGNALQLNADKFGPLSGVVKSAGEALTSLGKATTDVGDVFQALWERDWAEAWQEAQSAFGHLKDAATSAFDSISQFAGIALDWVLDTGIPTVIGWVSDYAGDVWGGIKTIVGWTWNAAVDLGGWTLNVAIPSVIGGITSIAGRLGDWLKGVLLGGMASYGDGTGGPDPFGTSGSLSATIGAWTLNVGVPSVVGAITGIAGRLGDWLRDYLYGGTSIPNPFGGSAGSIGGAGGGITVEIGQIILEVLDAVANLTSADVNGQIQKEVKSLTDGVDFAVDGINLVIGAITGESVSTTGDIPGAIQTFIDNTKKEYEKTVDLLVTINTVIGGIGNGGSGGGGLPALPNPFGGSESGSGRVQEWVDSHFPAEVYKTINAVMNYEITNVPGDLIALKDKIVEHLNGIKIVAADLADVAKSAGESIANAIKNQVDSWSGETVKSAITSKVNGLTVAAGDVASFASSIASAIWDAIKAEAANWDPRDLIPSFKMSRDFSADAAAAQEGTFGKNDFSSLGSSLRSQLDQIIGDVNAKMSELATAVDTGVQTALTALGNLGTGAQQADQTVSQSFNAITQTVQLTMSQSQQVIQQTATASTQAITQMSQQAQQVVTAGFEAVKQSITTNMQQAEQAVNTNAGQMTNRLNQFATDAGDAGDKSGDSFKRGITSGMDASERAVDRAVDAMKSAMSFDAYGEGNSAGASFGRGAVDGVSAYSDSMYNAGVGLANSVVAGFNSVSKPGSPSKTATKQGKVYGEGLYVGAASWLEPLKSMGRQLGGSLASESEAVFSASANSRTARNLAKVGGGDTYNVAMTGDDLLRLLRKAERGAAFVENVGTASRAGLAGAGVRLGS